MSYSYRRADSVRPGEAIVVFTPAHRITDPPIETTEVVTIASTIKGRTRLEYPGGSATYTPSELVRVVGFECGYCGDAVRFDAEQGAYVHTTSAERITAIGPGDYVSARHNRAGTVVNPVDVVESEVVDG